MNGSVYPLIHSVTARTGMTSHILRKGAQIQYCLIQSVPFFLPPDMAALSHRKPSSAGTPCDSLRIQGHDKRDTLYTLFGTVTNFNSETTEI